MVATVWPVDPVDTDSDGIPDFPVYAGRALRQMFSVLLNGHKSGALLGARSGLKPGTPDTSVTVTPTDWTMNPLCGVIDLEPAAEAAAYLFAFDAAVTGALTPANGANDRIDILSIQLSDPAEADGSTVPGVSVVYTTGTASSSPVAPATPALAMRIAQFNVPRATTGDPTVTWVARYMSAAGAITPCINSTGYPTTPYSGQYIDDLTLGGLQRWNGTRWIPLLQSGDFSYTIPNGNVSVTGTFAYPIGYSNAPNVQVATVIGTARHSVLLTGRTFSGFSWRAFRADGTAATSDEPGQITWLATP